MRRGGSTATIGSSVSHMERDSPSLEALRTAAPAVFALLALATAPWWANQLPPPLASPLWPLPVLWILTVIAAAYTSPGRWTLGLGAAALPAAFTFFGPALAALGAGLAVALREFARHLLLKDSVRRRGTLELLSTTANAGRLVLAVLASGIVWALGGLQDWPGLLDGKFWMLACLAVYSVTLLGLRLLNRRPGKSIRSRNIPQLLASLGIDLLGWLVGLLILQVILFIGWGPGLGLLTAVALLAAEAARNIHLRHRAVSRVAELWEVTRAGHRIIHRNPDLAGLAEQVLDECRRVLNITWYQFELPQGQTGLQSWRSGPDGRIEEGIPTPSDSPPPLPGIHRRSSWRILSRELKENGDIIARLRFWCDPRQIEPSSVELLDSLLPQVTASVHRALLDRRAKHDVLTGLPDRSVLQARLEKVFLETRDEGGSMAVVMCDLDRFKRINDKYGHDVGDQALIKVAELLEAHRRDTDLCCRFGGEEFSLVLEKTDGETAHRVAERLRIEIERCTFVIDERRILLRMSTGIAAYPELHVKEARDLLLVADEALLMAKRKGRNRSLLSLGQGRFGTADHKVIGEDPPQPEIEPPTLFA